MVRTVLALLGGVIACALPAAAAENICAEGREIVDLIEDKYFERNRPLCPTLRRLA